VQIILSRHGNTFSPGDKIIRAGRGEDLPLVEKGVEQAQTLAQAFSRSKLKPSAIYAGPLLRTKEFARIIAEELSLSFTPVTDNRLNELSYGKWAGLTDTEILETFGADELDAWNKHSIWPASDVWQEKEAEIIEEVLGFTAELSGRHTDDETILLISSNGRLRYFLKLVENEFETRARDGNFKMKTGSVSKILSEQGSYSLLYWNQDPALMDAL